MPNHYPIVKYPPLVERYLNDEIPELDKEYQPSIPTFEKNNYLTLIISFVMIIVAIYLLFSLFTFKKLLYSLLIIYIGFFLLKGSFYELKRTKKNNFLIKEKYKTLLKEYNERQFIKFKLNKQLSDKKEREEYKRKKITEICNSACEGHFNYEQESKKGATEKYFSCVLFAYFGNKIRTDYTIEPSGFSIFRQFEFIPDFSFIDKDISIDIEIDEPYTLEEKHPIHLLNDLKEEIRDSFFTSQNWIVIRFSENQIIENPFGCVKFINRTVKEIIGKEKNVINFSNISDSLLPNNVSKWTIDEVNRLINLNYRENMLLKINHDYLPRFTKLFKDKFVVIDTKVFSCEDASFRHIKYLKPLFGVNKNKKLHLESAESYEIGEWVEFKEYEIIEKVIEYDIDDYGRFSDTEYWIKIL